MGRWLPFAFQRTELHGSKIIPTPSLGIRTSGPDIKAQLSLHYYIQEMMAQMSSHRLDPLSTRLMSQNNEIANQGFYSIGINDNWLNGNQVVAARLLIAPNEVTSSHGGAHYGPIVTLQGIFLSMLFFLMSQYPPLRSIRVPRGSTAKVLPWLLLCR